MDNKIKAIIIFLFLIQVLIVIPTNILVNDYRVLRERFTIFIDLKENYILTGSKNSEIEGEMKEVSNKIRKLDSGRYSIYREMVEVKGLNKRLDNLNNKLLEIVR